MGKAIKIFLGVGEPESNEAAMASLAALLNLEQELRRHGVLVQTGRHAAVLEQIGQCSDYQPGFAVQIGSSTDGGKVGIYHQVTPNWEWYRGSHHMALLLQQQIRRYQRVQRRDIQAGANSAWLSAVQAPAVVCVQPLSAELDVYGQLSTIQTQAKAYARAILQYYGIRYGEVAYPVALLEVAPEPSSEDGTLFV